MSMFILKYLKNILKRHVKLTNSLKKLRDNLSKQPVDDSIFVNPLELERIIEI